MNWVHTQIKYQDDFFPLILADDQVETEGLREFTVISISNSINRRILKYSRFMGIRKIPSEYKEGINRYQPRILHSHFGDRAWFDIPIVEKFSLRQIVTFYGYDLSLLPNKRPVWKKRYRGLFERADQFLCEGPFMAQSLVDLGCPKEKVRIHQLGVDLANIPFVPRHIESNGKIRILLVGRFIEKKGIPFALQAIGNVVDKYPKLEITIIGDSTGTRREEIEKSKILKMIEDADLGDITHLTGFLPTTEVMDLAYKHHIFLSPSVKASDGDAEGGVPVSIIEMLASGMPVVSTTHCDIPGVVEHGVSGFLAPERDVDTLAEYLLWIIDNNEKWNEMVDAGRNHIEVNFNAKIQGERLMQIYQEL